MEREPVLWKLPINKPQEYSVLPIKLLLKRKPIIYSLENHTTKIAKAIPVISKCWGAKFTNLPCLRYL